MHSYEVEVVDEVGCKCRGLIENQVVDIRRVNTSQKTEARVTAVVKVIITVVIRGKTAHQTMFVGDVVIYSRRVLVEVVDTRIIGGPVIPDGVVVVRNGILLGIEQGICVHARRRNDVTRELQFRGGIDQGLPQGTEVARPVGQLGELLSK